METKFYYPNGEAIIKWEDFLDYYNKAYYLYVSESEEKVIETLLSNKADFSDKQIYSFLCWKLGFPYSPNDEADVTLLHTRTPIAADCLKVIDAIQKEYNYIDDDNIDEIYSKLKKIDGIGTIYAIAVIYLLSRGRFPIYDRFVRLAMYAINEGKAPNATIRLKSLDGGIKIPKEYYNYLDFIKSFGSTSYMERKVDRALWTYGHLFRQA